MTKKLCAIVFLPLLLLATATHAVAATDILPEGATIAIGTFSFPDYRIVEDNKNNHDLPVFFRHQVMTALQQQGFVTVDPVPKKKNDSKKEIAGEIPGKNLPQKTETDKGNLSPEEALELEERELFGETESEEQVVDVTDVADATEEELDDLSRQLAVDSGQEEAGAPVLTDGIANYVLNGKVIQYRESIGSQAKIGNTPRIRIQSSMQFAYTVSDAQTGKVIISDIASGSAGKISADIRNADTLSRTLGENVMAITAKNLANRLTGVTFLQESKPKSATASEDDEYYDSPGKRLKPKQ